MLRTLSADDAPAFAAHIAGDLARLSEFLPWPARTDTVDGARAWLSSYDAQEGGRALVAGIEREGRLLGGVVLIDHDVTMGSVELGCWVVAEGEGHGAVRAACVEALRHARHVLGVERVAWHCDPDNHRSRLLAEGLGFRYEGRLRSSYVLRGERHDTDVLSLVGAEIDLTLA